MKTANSSFQLLHRDLTSLRIRSSSPLPLQSVQEPRQFQEMVQNILESFRQVSANITDPFHLYVCFELNQDKPHPKTLVSCSDELHIMELGQRSDPGGGQSRVGANDLPRSTAAQGLYHEPGGGLWKRQSLVRAIWCLALLLSKAFLEA